MFVSRRFSALFHRWNTESLTAAHVNRNANREQFSGAMRAPSITVPRGMDLTEMGFQMHCLEMEAYNAILRAFFAQSDGLTWMQWGDGAAINSNQENFGQGLNSVGHGRQALSMVKGRASMVVHMKKRFSDMGMENFNKGSNYIQILATDKLIDEVETVLREHPKPSQVEKVKLILGEHEKELSEALEKVVGVLDDDDSPDHLQQPYSHQYMQRFEHGTHRPVFGQVDRVKGYFPDGFGRDLADRSGIPLIDLQGGYV